MAVGRRTFFLIGDYILNKLYYGIQCLYRFGYSHIRYLVILSLSISCVIYLLIPAQKPEIAILCMDRKHHLDSPSCICLTDDKTLLDEFLYVDKYTLKQSPYEIECAMTIEPRGRLGNLMGEYASLLALSRYNQRRPVLLPTMSSDLQIYFNLKIPAITSTMSENIPWTVYEINDWMLPEYKHIPANFVKLFGYPCSWTFFHHMREEIKTEFSFRADIVNEAQTYLKKLKKTSETNVTYIGVHVRRGDYVNLIQEYDGVLADHKYFEKAMNYYRTKYRNCIFVIASEDLDWCKENINGTRGDVYFGWNGTPSSAGYDMALLAQCNHSIMSIGTFGFWASYLAGGEVIYLNNYTRPGSKFHEVFRYEAAFLPEWIGIPANLTKSVLPSMQLKVVPGFLLVFLMCFFLLVDFIVLLR